MVLYMLLDIMLQNSSGYFHIRINCSIEHSFFIFFLFFFFLLSRHTVITWWNHKLIIIENQLNLSVIKSNLKKSLWVYFDFNARTWFNDVNNFAYYCKRILKIETKNKNKKHSYFYYIYDIHINSLQRSIFLVSFNIFYHP